MYNISCDWFYVTDTHTDGVVVILLYSIQIFQLGHLGNNNLAQKTTEATHQLMTVGGSTKIGSSPCIGNVLLVLP